MSTTFPTADQGYDPAQVDDFMAQARAAYENEDGDAAFNEVKVREVAFKLVKNGYSMAAVDLVLERLEAGFVHRRRAKVMQEHGEDEWIKQVAQLASTIYPRLDRPVGERFEQAPKGEYGYLKTEVDSFMDSLGRYFDGDLEMTSQQIKRVVFTPAKGDKAYAMAVVDAYLDRASEILISVE